MIKLSPDQLTHITSPTNFLATELFSEAAYWKKQWVLQSTVQKHGQLPHVPSDHTIHVIIEPKQDLCHSHTPHQTSAV